MSERIAEFIEDSDAMAFMRMKNREAGEDIFTVCGGIHLPLAVMPKIRYATNLGRPNEPAETAAFDNDYDEDERE